MADLDLLPAGFFSGGKNITEDSDAGLELGGKLNEIIGRSNAHAGRHVTGGGDVIANVVAGGASGLMSGADKTKLDAFAGPFQFIGAIGAAADFPAAAAVAAGHTYRVTADVTDNAGAPAHTNTGLSFLAGSTIAWTGTTWCDIGDEEGATFAVATPIAVAGGDRLIMVDTVTIAAPSVVNLPAAAAAIVGKKIPVVDASGGAAPGTAISVTPAGADTIDGIAAAVLIDGPFESYTFECVQIGAAAYGWTTLGGREARTATARLAAIGAGRSQHDSRQLAAASETLRVFRALAAGRILACAAETGTVAAAGESMTFDVQIAGATALTGLITVDSAIAIDTPVAGVVGAGALAEFAAGELVSVVRVYVPGGGATPMRDTVVDIEVQFD
jgi:hypothetical protein